ncbi:MAG: HEAT repeat domain-containing protein, partial [Planctomycetes bacterium]|nr:HEAT repeat domain-containing protein [Planctomycetota bacterium]
MHAMNDEDFERIRDALSPARDQTTRLGGLFVLESLLDDDDRIVSLIATLLLDRDPAVAGATAALAYRTRLALALHEELHKTWTNAPTGYRDALLEHASPTTLDGLLSYFLSASDSGLRRRYVARLREHGSPPKLAFAALELARDSEPDLRRTSAEILGEVEDEDAPGCLSVLLEDDVDAVRDAALLSFAKIA